MSDPPRFEEIYDEETLRALDEWRPPAQRPLRGWRARAAGGALATALVTGVKDALDTDELEPEISELDPGQPSHLQPVTLLWVPDDPAATVAIVRPWLF